MSAVVASVSQVVPKTADKKRVAWRLPEDSKTLDVLGRVRDGYGTNASGDLVRRWVLRGCLSWLRDGGIERLEDWVPKGRLAVDKRRMSCRLDRRMPEDRKVLDVLDVVRDALGTNAAGDLLGQWMTSGWLSWLQEGGLESLSDRPLTIALPYNNENNTPSNNHDVSSDDESRNPGSGVDLSTEIESPSMPAPARPAGFVGMLGMGLSQEVPRG